MSTVKATIFSAYFTLNVGINHRRTLSLSFFRKQLLDHDPCPATVGCRVLAGELIFFGPVAEHEQGSGERRSGQAWPLRRESGQHLLESCRIETTVQFYGQAWSQEQVNAAFTTGP